MQNNGADGPTRKHPGEFPLERLALLRTAPGVGEPQYLWQMHHPTGGASDAATRDALSRLTSLQPGIALFFQDSHRGTPLHAYQAAPIPKAWLAASLRLLAGEFEAQLAGVLTPQDIARLREVVNATIEELDYSEPEIGPGDPLLRFFWELFYGMWYKMIRWLRQLERSQKAGWNEPFDHDWSCAEKCRYWKRKADHIVKHKHNNSPGKLRANEANLQECLDCCDDYRSCGESVRGSDDFFTWLLGVP